MKRSESFVNNFKTVNIEMMTNVDDEIIKSMSHQRQVLWIFLTFKKNQY
jgi:hypothetical protein